MVEVEVEEEQGQKEDHWQAAEVLQDEKEEEAAAGSVSVATSVGAEEAPATLA